MTTEKTDAAGSSYLFYTKRFFLLMAGSPSFPVEPPGKTVSITVLDGHDLKGLKGDSPVTFVRVEYNGFVLGDSPKMDASAEGNVKYNFTTSFDSHPEGFHTLDDIAHKPRIADCRCWPVEITRVPLVTSTKVKAGKGDKGGATIGGTEEDPISFHGVAYVSLVPLLYPGVKRIRGAFRVFPYHDSEVFEKPSNIVKKDTSEITVDTAVSVCQNLEGQQYVECGSFIVIEFTLDKALVPKRLPEELASRVKEMIPPHPQLPRRTAGAMKAVEDYHTQITSIAASILDEYHELFGRQVVEGLVIDSQTLEDQKCQLNYELNTSGKYFAFKEQLKHAVVKIVREKYLKTTAFETLDQLQAFLSELYVYLMDQMHVALNQVLSLQTPSPPPPVYTTLEQLQLFAREAQRLARNPQDSQSWLDYGAFCLLTEDNLKAQECFREAVGLDANHLPRYHSVWNCGQTLTVLAGLDANHLPSVLLCGIMAVMLQNYEEAEVFFEDATCVEPSSVVAWTMLGLFYDMQENYIRVEMAFREATKLQKARLPKEKPSPPSTEEVGKKRMLYMTSQGQSLVGPEESGESPESAAKIQAESSEPASSLRATEEDTVHKPFKRLSVTPSKYRLSTQRGGPSCEYYLVLAQTYMLKKDYDQSEESLEMAMQIDYLNPEVWAQKGHLCYLTGNFSEAKSCYERTISFVTDAKDMHTVYLRLGSIYLEGKEGGRQLEAEQSYKYAVKLELDNPELLQEVKQVQLEVGFGDPSF
ncbi:hypothetical protein Chor_015126 [Crotalus horridus]